MANANLYVNAAGSSKIQIDNNIVELYNSSHHSSTNALNLANYGFTDASMLGDRYVKANSGYNLSYYAIAASDFYDLPYYYNNTKIPFALQGSAPIIQGINTYSRGFTNTSSTVSFQLYNNRPSLYINGTNIKYGNSGFIIACAGGGGGSSTSYDSGKESGSGGGSGAAAFIYFAFKKTGASNLVLEVSSTEQGYGKDGKSITIKYGSTVIGTLNGGKAGYNPSSNSVHQGGDGGTPSFSYTTYNNDYIYIRVLASFSGGRGGNGGKTWGINSSSSSSKGADFSTNLSYYYKSGSFAISNSAGGCNGGAHHGGSGAASIFNKGADCGGFSTSTTGANGSGGGGAAYDGNVGGGGGSPHIRFYL